jgi:hypothetical protein
MVVNGAWVVIGPFPVRTPRHVNLGIAGELLVGRQAHNVVSNMDRRLLEAGDYLVQRAAQVQTLPKGRADESRGFLGRQRGACCCCCPCLHGGCLVIVRW